MKSILKVILVLIFLFIVFKIGMAGVDKDLKQAQECTPVYKVDIDGNYQVMCDE